MVCYYCIITFIIYNVIILTSFVLAVKAYRKVKKLEKVIRGE